MQWTKFHRAKIVPPLCNRGPIQLPSMSTSRATFVDENKNIPFGTFASGLAHNYKDYTAKLI